MTLDVLAYEDALYRRASGLLQGRLPICWPPG
jgi:hypothetical protein